MQNEINSMDQLPQQLTQEMLAVQTRTGKAVTTFNAKQEKVKSYRLGHLTAIGDIEDSVWAAAVDRLAEQLGEQKILAGLITWVTEKASWLHSSPGREMYAKELYLARIWENTRWLGYMEFRENYIGGVE